MFLGVSISLLLACGWLGAGLIGLRSFWERLLGSAVWTMAQLVLTSLTVGLLPGGYRPLPLLGATSLVFLVLLLLSLSIKCPPLGVASREDRPYVLAFVTVVAVTLPIWIWEFFNGLLLPPIYWDELYYHLVAPAVWAREGWVHFFATNNPFVAGYPANFELIPSWTMAMTGRDVFADLTGLPFVFVGLAVVIAFCARLGVRPRHSFWAGLLFVTTPMVIFHAKSAYIDLPMAVTFGVACYFLFLFASGGQIGHLVVGAMAMGLVVGAKYSGLYMAVAGLVPILYRMRARRSRRPSWPGVLAGYAIPLLVLGGFFYFRNLILFGNPVYPMRLEIAGITLFAGRYKSAAFNFTAPENTWLTLVKAIAETDPYPKMDSYYAGFGPQLLLLAIPATILFLVRGGKQRGLVFFTWLFPLLLSIATLPAKYPRYLVHINLFLLPFAGAMLDGMSRGWGRLLKAAVVSFALYSVLIATPLYDVPPQHYDLAAKSVWTASRVGVGAQYAYIDGLNEKRRGPLRIVTGNLRLTYPLLGPGWRNELICISPVTERQWIREMLKAGADLFATDDTGEAAREKEWIGRHPELFRLLFSDSVVGVYLVLPGDSDHRAFVRRLGLRRGEG